MLRISAAVLALLAAVMLMGTAVVADTANGEKLARRWCASCHVVAPDQSQGNTQAAPFSEMAKLPGLDAAKLALFLLAPHPPMPDMSLSRNEASDLAAYIAAQRK